MASTFSSLAASVGSAVARQINSGPLRQWDPNAPIDMHAGDGYLRSGPAPIWELGLPTWQRTLGIALLSVFVVVPYVKRVIMPAPPGAWRWILSTPVLLFNLATPCLFNDSYECLERLISMFILAWLANFKLMAFCLNRGPLVGHWSMLQIAAIQFQPIYPVPRATAKAKDYKNGRLHDSAGKPHEMLLRCLTKAGLFAFGVYSVDFTKLKPPLFRDMLLVIGLYCFVGILMDGPGSLIIHYLEVDLIPTFDQPWMSSSLTDFWSRRWNNSTSHVLRCLIYDPLAEGCFIKDPKHHKHGKRRRASEVMRALGTCLTFFVSGLIHEIVLWACQMDGKWTWKWLGFFTAQGPLVILEYYAAKWLARRGIKPNPWLGRALTVPFLMVVGHYFFFAPVTYDTDTADRFLQASLVKVKWALGALDGVKMKLPAGLMRLLPAAAQKTSG